MDINVLEQSLGIPKGLYANLINKGEASGETATSPKGAYGKAQLMPGTAADLGVDPNDPDQNLYGGAKYLKQLLDRYHGDETKAVEAYNEGMGRVDKGIVYPETASYVRRVTGANVVPNAGTDTSVASDPQAALAGLYAAAEKSPALKQWLAASSAYQKTVPGTQAALKDVQGKIQGVEGEIGKDQPVKAPTYDTNLPNEEDLKKQELAKVSDKPMDPTRVLGQFLPMLAILGGAFAKNGSVASLKAAAAAMGAAKTNDKEALDRAHQEFMDSTQILLDKANLEHMGFSDAIQAKNMTMEDRRVQLSVLAAETGNIQMQDAVNHGDMDRAAGLVDMYGKALKPLTDLMAAQQKVNQKQQVLQDTNGTPYVYNMITHEATTLNGEPYQPTGAKHIEAGRPISMAADVMKSFDQEHPNATASEKAQFVSEYGAKTAGAKAFATGKQGDTVRSLNVAIAHMDLFKELAQAEANGDIQTVNKLRNQWKTEFGEAAPSNVKAAGALVGDEVIKAVTAGGGALADRENAQNQFSNFQSWQQVQGVVDTYQRLLGGQLGGLRQQYEHATGDTNFDDMLLPETKNALGIKDAQAGGGDLPSDLPPAEGHKDGTKAKDESGKVVAVIRNGQWVAP